MKDDNLKKYIESQESYWFDKISPFILKGKVLKIGNGFGRFSENIRPLTKDLTILDIEINEDTINKDKVEIYNGFPIPYPDKSFDTSIILLTLHHIPKNTSYFDEILRVTSGRIIILEETYDNLFQKIHLYIRDYFVNKTIGQKVELHWGSYFSRKKIRELFKKCNLKEIFVFSKKHKTYFKELFVLEF